MNADHKFFYIEVADSGIRIAEDEVEHIFERFYRVINLTQRNRRHRAWACYSKKCSCNASGRDQSVQSAGEGTTFTMRIPLNYVA